MLNQEGKKFERIAREEGYTNNELLDAEDVKVYVAKESSQKLEGGARNVKCQTLVRADIKQHLGIEVTSFDDTIDEMNRIEEALIWGDDEE